MRTHQVIRKCGAGICLLFFLILNSCSSPSEEITPKPDTAIEVPKPVTHSVEISQMKFIPDGIVANKGDTVIFTNHDMVTHDITEESHKAWSSSPLPKDSAWVLVVTESVNYYCSIHPVMKGKIVVE